MRPIDWQAIGEIRQRLNIPVIANGEIWDWQSAQQCMAISGCDAVMIGRGALNIPNLSRVVKYNEPRMPWPEVVSCAISTLVVFLVVSWSSQLVHGERKVVGQKGSEE